MLDLNVPEMRFALEAVRQVALLVKQVQAELVSAALTKNDRSPVTVADFAAQALVGRLLVQAFPGDLLVAEEDASALRLPERAETRLQVAQFVGRFEASATPERVCDWIDHQRADSAARFWTLDPIDGTKGFLRGEQYAVALALVENGQAQIGVLGCPNLSDSQYPEMGGPGSLAAAQRGHGAWTSPLAGDGGFRRLAVSARSEPAQARLLRSVEAAHTNVDQVDELTRLLGSQGGAVRMDSQAKYAVLAAGGAELMVRLLSPEKPNYREKIWDQAAGSLVLEEAGGRVTDLDGRPFDFTTGRSLTQNRGVLASNSALHAAALDALRQMRA
jgi:3'(2'), 5'-bisphosphate nucleotidase